MKSQALHTVWRYISVRLQAKFEIDYERGWLRHGMKGRGVSAVRDVSATCQPFPAGLTLSSTVAMSSGWGCWLDRNSPITLFMISCAGKKSSSRRGSTRDTTRASEGKPLRILQKRTKTRRRNTPMGSTRHAREVKRHSFKQKYSAASHDNELISRKLKTGYTLHEKKFAAANYSETSTILQHGRTTLKLGRIILERGRTNLRHKPPILRHGRTIVRRANYSETSDERLSEAWMNIS